ncbi:(Fe-S)-binding protein [Candidatus Albibeggiatoa sp. nov. NOAA]|uniref:(Fe-S)-binding protein n=1 Tax=Candidatus Albibeggiatoa sp. nov. NOAA TaxID=3162724 RepID=UPI0032F3BCD3|nr:(Fe-S)-binding protein [Thiotrichaceae bacterium]
MKTYLDWSFYKDAGMGDAYADIPKTGGHFAKAVAVCIKSGLCETERKGVMCPCYRVSEHSDFSTGGRVRLLKQALNGELGNLPFVDQALARTMELCVGCKGCKRECENAVDMAMLKIEYLAQRYQQQKPSLRTCLFGNLAEYWSRFPLLRHLPALHNRYTWLAKLNQTLLGISADAHLPEPVKKPFQIQNHDSIAATNEVVLFIDTFTRNFHPENAHAALQVLETAGYRVYLADLDLQDKKALCCGRTQLAHGLVAGAKQNAQKMLAVLTPHVKAGRPIIGLEPACLLAIRDDYKFLGLGEEAEHVAKKAILFEEFIAKEKTAKRFKLDFKPVQGTILVHGHCHQKAVGAMKSMRKVLKLVPELKFEFIESSCCGMAGSFGIEAENAEMAKQMAELNLLPALREQPEAVVIANGFSCQHQIRSHTEHQPKHIAVFLRDAMSEPNNN